MAGIRRSSQETWGELLTEQKPFLTNYVNRNSPEIPTGREINQQVCPVAA